MSSGCFRAALLLMATTAFGQSGAVRLTPIGGRWRAGHSRTARISDLACGGWIGQSSILPTRGCCGSARSGRTASFSTVAGTGVFQSGPDGAPAVSTAVSPRCGGGFARERCTFRPVTRWCGRLRRTGRWRRWPGSRVQGRESATEGIGGGGEDRSLGYRGRRFEQFVYAPTRPLARVRKVTPDGIIHTVAGTGQSGVQGRCR